MRSNSYRYDEESEEGSSPPLLIASLLPGTVVGVIIGVLAMAIEVLTWGIFSGSNSLLGSGSGLSLAAITFALFTAFGSLAATLFFWHWRRQTSDTLR